VNRERQAVEEAHPPLGGGADRGGPESRRRRHGYALADADWHEGVIGIVASRLVERYHRPVVLIAGGRTRGRGQAAPSAHSTCTKALSACSDHLLRWGGHRAAAGLSIDPSEVDAFARAFAEHADGMLSEQELAPVAFVDAIVPRGLPLTLDLAQELAQLAPFGLGNPGVTLLAPSCELRDLGTVGDGKHLKFRVRGENGATRSAIAFGLGSHLDRLRRAGPLRRPSSGSRRTAGTARSRRSSSCGRVFDSEDRYERALRRGLQRSVEARFPRSGSARSLRTSSPNDAVKAQPPARVGNASARCSQSRRPCRPLRS
jgi:hypothetical protein